MASLDKSRISIIEFSKIFNINAGAMSLTSTFGKDVRINFLSLKQNGGYNNTVTLLLASQYGAAFEHTLSTFTVNATTTGFFYQPAQPLVLLTGTEVRLTAPQGGNASTRFSIVLSGIEI